MNIVVNILLPIFMEILPILISLTIKSFRTPTGLHAAVLGLKIAIMLSEIRGAPVEDLSEAIMEEGIDFSNQRLQRLDLTDSQINNICLNHAKLGQVSAYKLKSESLSAVNIVCASVDFSEAEIKALDLRGAKVAILDLSKAQIGTLVLQQADILSLDLSEATINAIVGGNQARIYLQDRWKSKISHEE
mgnify:CR=1 FL=1